MAHPSIPKSEPQETSGVSLGASAGSSAGGGFFFLASEGHNNYKQDQFNNKHIYMFKILKNFQD